MRRVMLGIAVTGILGLMVAYAYYSAKAEQEDISKVGEMPERSIVFDRRGTYIGELHGANRVIIPVDGVSPLFKDALLAREDTRFYSHHGIDPRGVARAIVRNIKDGSFVQGASTLTMQLARVSYEIRDKSLNRKFLEMMLAMRIEANYSKDEILGLYMNRIYFGSGIYGIERASNAYFGKHAHELGLAEAAMLAGIIRGPNRFSPFRHYEAALHERDTVLDRMLALGFITEDEANKAKQTNPKVLDQGSSPIQQNSYVLSLVRKELDEFLDKKDTEEGGLKIYVTLDADLQKAAEASMEERLLTIEQRGGYKHQTRADYQALLASLPEGAEVPAPDYLQGALVAIDNRSGGIRALVGGRDFKESQYDRATMGQRQIGSLFKPFVYASAYSHGLWPLTLVDDNPLYHREVDWWQGTWSPRNSDGTHMGPQTAEYGLIHSRNTMTIRVGEIAGFESIWTMADEMQLKMPEEKSPQLYIGNVGTNLTNITRAFTAFPSEGVISEPYLLDVIQDRKGNILYEHMPKRSRLLPAGPAWLTNQTLQKVMEGGGTGSAARSLGLLGPAGGKTGTTDAFRDAWFIGYNSRLTCGVWVGLDSPATIHEGGYGSSVALPIWTDTMIHAQQHHYPSEAFRSDLEFVNVQLCQQSGQLASVACNRQGTAYDMRIPYEMIPRENCPVHGQGGLFQRRNEDQEGKGIFDRFRGLFR